MNAPSKTAREFLDEVSLWVLEHSAEAGFKIRSSAERRMPDGSKLGIEITTPNALALVQAWRHATCLDVDIMDTRSNETVFSEAGAVTGKDQMRARLQRFWSALSAINSAAV